MQRVHFSFVVYGIIMFCVVLDMVFLWHLPTGGGNLSIFMSRNFGYRVVPINCDFSGPAERVRFLAC